MHEMFRPRPPVSPAHQIRQQPPLAHHRGKMRELAGTLDGHRPHLDLRIDGFVLEGPAHRFVREPPVYPLREQIHEQPRRPAPAGQAYRGVLRRKATVIEQPASREPLERRVYGRGGMLPLNEPPPQIGARVRAPAQRAQRGPVGGFDIGELLQPPEHRA